MTSEQPIKRILEAGAVAVLRTRGETEIERICEALLEGGLPVIEITMIVPGALEAIARGRTAFGEALCIGAGSVLDAETARRAVDAGAGFIVSPVFLPEVMHAAGECGASAIPGAFTPTEIFRAAEAGAEIVKVFPADALGPPFIKAVLAPMPKLRLMPTGGVTPANAGDWLRAGACAVGLGASLLDPAALAEMRYSEIAEKTRGLMESIRRARAN